MLIILIVACCSIISRVNCAPRPQEETVELQPPIFSIDNIAQRIGLPQGFTVPNRDARQAADDSSTVQSAADDLSQFGVVRYFFEQEDFAYKYT